jgi:hypothetical protein
MSVDGVGLREEPPDKATPDQGEEGTSPSTLLAPQVATAFGSQYLPCLTNVRSRRNDDATLEKILRGRRWQHPHNIPG